LIVRHATDLVEHSELVADRLITFTEIVGQENVIAGTDCGLRGRVHPHIAWAKLRACATAPRSRARSCRAEFKSPCAG
jgi:5-methyltetrahydropteroyltriglutamate--homocysteine methyltransferase